jgi:hypothetical protein
MRVQYIFLVIEVPIKTDLRIFGISIHRRVGYWLEVLGKFTYLHLTNYY